jgi:hypothetical protein
MNEMSRVIEYEGETKVVKADQLEYLTNRLKWVVLATYEVDIPSWDYVTEREGVRLYGAPKRLIEGQAPDYGYSRPDDKVRDDETPHFLLRCRYFILGRSKDKVVERMRERMRRLEEEAYAAKSTANGQKADAEISFNRAENYKKELDEQRKANTETTDMCRAMQKSAKKMEDDLAKVREALGAQRWKEIVG